MVPALIQISDNQIQKSDQIKKQSATLEFNKFYFDFIKYRFRLFSLGLLQNQKIEMSISSKDSFWAELESKLKEGLANLNSSPTDYQPILNQLQALTQLTVEDDFIRYQVLSYSNLN